MLKEPMRPQRGSEKIKPLSYPETKKIQKGKLGTEGADNFIQPDFGGLPSSGNFQPNAGMSGGAKGGSAVTSASAMSHKGGKDSKSAGPMDRGAAVTHTNSKAPLKPKSPGGANTGSVDTMTKLIFHPKGGLGKTGKSKGVTGAGGFKESGSRSESARKDAGVSSRRGAYGA